MTMKVLGAYHITAIERRGISAETAARLGLFSASISDGCVEPDAQGTVLVFPYVEAGVEIGQKYRGPNKQFWQKAGSPRGFWNADILFDDGLQHNPLIIVEGEFDALAVIESGFPYVVSVPDGAPAVPAGRAAVDLDPIDVGADARGKFSFLWRHRDQLKRIPRFIIATDKDGPGERLAAELVRRLSAAKCLFLQYPPDCKDLNDVLMKHGRDGVTAVITGAKLYPMENVYGLDDYPDLDLMPIYSTGWPILNDYLQLFDGEFMVITGVPGSGKSTWVLNLLLNMYCKYGWRSVMYSPEMRVVPYLRNKLRRMIGGLHPDDVIRDAFRFIEGINPRNRRGDVPDLTLPWLLDRATDAVVRNDVRLLLIDPWNELDHARGRDQTTSEYIGDSIRQLKAWSRDYDAAVLVVAHPTKDVSERGKIRTPTLYDIDGSANWANKCDHGVVIHRPDPHRDETEIYINKARLEETGSKGMVRMSFDRATSTYGALDASRSVSVGS